MNKNVLKTGILSVPAFILMNIAIDLEDGDLFAFMMTCKHVYNKLKKPFFLKNRLTKRYKVEKDNNFTSFLSIGEEDIDWKMKYRLTRLMPTMMCTKDCYDKLILGLEFSNQDDELYLDAKSNKPFVSTNPLLKEILSKDLLSQIYFKGIDYFEVNVIHIESCLAVGIADEFFDGKQRLVGWNVNTLGYHSDDGTLRNYEEGTCNTLKTFESGDTVGFGVDWERDLFFSTKNGELVGVRKYSLRKDIPYFPTVTLTSHGDFISVNLGETPFLFDLTNYAFDPLNQKYFVSVDISFAKMKQAIEEDEYNIQNNLITTNKRRPKEKCHIF